MVFALWLKKMNIFLPEKKELLNNSIAVAVAPEGTSWFQNCLGELASEKGVYVIHHRDDIKYIGKTNGKSMSFGMRLRRHFQEKAAGRNHTYQKLSVLPTPPGIMVKMIPLKEIKKYIQHDIAQVNKLDLIPLFEAALIVSLKPEFQCENT